MIAIMSDAVEALFVRAPVWRLASGAVLFRAGDAVERMFLVRSGSVDLVRHGVGGATLILHRAGAGAVLAEASAWSDCYHCDAGARVASEVAALPRVTFVATLERDARLACAWAAVLARSVQATRLKAEIRTLRSVGERLDAWLGEGGSFPERGRWQELAQELGVTREALYRELARRRPPAR